MTPPEQRARIEIDRLLEVAGWAVQDFRAANLHAANGVAQEIVEDLEAALEQFRLIAGDLGAKP